MSGEGSERFVRRVANRLLEVGDREAHEALVSALGRADFQNKEGLPKVAECFLKKIRKTEEEKQDLLFLAGASHANSGGFNNSLARLFRIGDSHVRNAIREEYAGIYERMVERGARLQEDKKEKGYG